MHSNNTEADNNTILQKYGTTDMCEICPEPTMKNTRTMKFERLLGASTYLFQKILLLFSSFLHNAPFWTPQRTSENRTSFGFLVPLIL